MKLDMLVRAMSTHNISQVQQVAKVEVCAICSHSNHITKTCPMSSFTEQEHANYVGQSNYPSSQEQPLFKYLQYMVEKSPQSFLE
jgi:hypothetical protein